jgi:hypothetical protein
VLTCTRCPHWKEKPTITPTRYPDDTVRITGLGLKMLAEKDEPAPDPVMEDLHVPGAKDDSEKLPVELVPVEAIEAIATVMNFGRQKYTENGWKSVPKPFRRYLAALLRHVHALQKGEITDPDSGLPHIYHVACNAAFLVWFHETDMERCPFEPEIIG